MRTTEPTPYPDLNAVLHELVTRAQEALGDPLAAGYLLGSFALGDFDVPSDVDFLIALEDEIADDRLDELQDMHCGIYDLDSHWAKGLDGSYVPKRILRRHDPTHARLLYLDNGSRELVRSDHCNKRVVRWVARAIPSPRRICATRPRRPCTTGRGRSVRIPSR